MEYKEIVIKVPKKDYDKLCRGELVDTVLVAIKNGMPLPKGHGRLIDADAFERRCMFDNDIEDMQDVIYALRDYIPIIEAAESEV